LPYLLTILDTQKQAIPADVEQSLRSLNNYANEKKASLGKVPKANWAAVETDILAEASRRNDLLGQA
jgi:hypothetical protein